MPPEREQYEEVTSRRSRRTRLKLRKGLNRDVPYCRVELNMGCVQEKPRSKTPMRQSRQISTLSHWTPMEGVPEKWLKRRSIRFWFTPIEGVTERMMEGRPAERVEVFRSVPASASRQQSLNYVSDMEGVPERWIARTSRLPGDLEATTKRQKQADQFCFDQVPAGELYDWDAGGDMEMDDIFSGQIPDEIESYPQDKIADMSEVKTESCFEAETVNLEPIEPVESVQSIQQSVVSLSRSSKQYSSVSLTSPAGKSAQSRPSSRRSDTRLAEHSSCHLGEIEIALEGEDRFDANGSRRGSLMGKCSSSARAPTYSILGSDVGTHWVNGCRRSTRDRCKPLRWWEGEHKVYSRTCNTIPTVSGYVTKNPDPEWPWPAPKSTHTTKRRR